MLAYKELNSKFVPSAGCQINEIGNRAEGHAVLPVLGSTEGKSPIGEKMNVQNFSASSSTSTSFASEDHIRDGYHSFCGEVRNMRGGGYATATCSRCIDMYLSFRFSEAVLSVLSGYIQEIERTAEPALKSFRFPPADEDHEGARKESLAAYAALDPWKREVPSDAQTKMIVVRGSQSWSAPRGSGVSVGTVLALRGRFVGASPTWRKYFSGGTHDAVFGSSGMQSCDYMPLTLEQQAELRRRVLELITKYHPELESPIAELWDAPPAVAA